MTLDRTEIFDNISGVMNDIQKKMRGRPKGATSTVAISLGDLLAKIGNNPETEIQVGRTWIAKFNAVNVETHNDVDELPENIREQLEDNAKVEFTIS